MREIKLSQGKVTVVDDCDYEALAVHKWHALRDYQTFYAVRNVPTATGRTLVYMHCEILAVEPGFSVDHIDLDGLNNTRANLRPANKHQNAYNRRKRSDNTSGLKGVCWHKKTGKWMAQIQFEGRHKYLGVYATPELAHAAYCEAAAKYHGAFARTG